MPIDERKVLDYYNSTEIDYRLFWNLDKSLAIHYGYWDKKTKTLPQALQKENEILAKKAKIKQSDHVLDAGCGIGGSSIFLAKNFGSKVTGITVVPRQIKLAIRNAKQHYVDHLVDFRKMDYSKTKFKSRSFDVVWTL